MRRAVVTVVDLTFVAGIGLLFGRSRGNGHFQACVQSTADFRCRASTHTIASLVTISRNAISCNPPGSKHVRLHQTWKVLEHFIG
jgi:hypothetical protein